MADQSGLAGSMKDLRMLSGEEAYSAAIDEVIGRAQRTLHIFDVNLIRGDYGSMARCEALRNFLCGSRGTQLVMVLHQTDYLTGHCPRLMLLLRAQGHAFSIRQTFEHARAASDVLIIADGQHYVHRFHHDGPRFLLALSDREGARPLESRFRELFDASFPAVSATTMGL
mgnify:CR=1 FL=1